MKSARPLAALLTATLLLLPGARCWAWGEEGHRVVALIAEHYLTPATRQRVLQTLALDTGMTPAVPADIAAAGGWADRYRDSDRNAAALRYRQTLRWHFVNLALQRPDLRSVCYDRPALAPGQLASRGPGRACIVDKIRQFRAEWLAPSTSPEERQLALLFLLHLVADLHQPLHAGDDDDHGGNDVDVSAPGFKSGSLHRYWDTAVLRGLDKAANRLAPRLIGDITSQQRRQWQSGDADDWAMEANALAAGVAYGKLPSARSGTVRRLTPEYVDAAEATAALQLSRAGVRLALLLEPAAR